LYVAIVVCFKFLGVALFEFRRDVRMPRDIHLHPELEFPIPNSNLPELCHLRLLIPFLQHRIGPMHSRLP